MSHAFEETGGFESGELGKRVAELRQKHKLTLEQVATMSGVSRSMLSQIERGSANPTLAVTFRIARAFGISVGELVDSDWETPNVEVIRGEDPKTIFRDDSDARVRTLSPLHTEKNIEFYEVRLGAGASLESEAHFDGTQEILTVVTGSIEIDSGEMTRDLVEGDSAYYRADVSHTIRNGGDGDALCFLVVTYS